MTGEVLGKNNETIKLAFQKVLGAPYFGINTPRIFDLKAIKTVLEDMPDIVWNLEREILGWGRRTEW